MDSLSTLMPLCTSHRAKPLIHNNDDGSYFHFDSFPEALARCEGRILRQIQRGNPSITPPRRLAAARYDFHPFTDEEELEVKIEVRPSGFRFNLFCIVVIVTSNIRSHCLFHSLPGSRRPYQHSEGGRGGSGGG